MLSPSTFAPAYSRLYDELISRLNAGHWKPGDQLPTERALAAEHSVSIGTVRKAMDMLAQGGFCSKVQGKGTFVCEYAEDKPLFYRMRRSLKGQDITLQPADIVIEEKTLPDEAAANLALRIGSSGIFLSRTLLLRTENSYITFGLSESWFSQELCHHLLQTSQADFKKHALYFLLERDCHCPMIFCDEFIRVCNQPPKRIQSILGENTPCFELVMIVHTYGKQPVEFRRTYLDGSSMGLMRTHDLRR